MEWTNDGCPFVGKHYNSGNMPALQRRFTEAGDVWLTITSSAPGEQGYVTPAEARADMARWHAAPSDFLLDPDGAVARLYGAKATPTMVVVDPKGVLAYIGAIDRASGSTDLDDVKTAKNYVATALGRTRGRKAGVGLGDPRLRVQHQIQDKLDVSFHRCEARPFGLKRSHILPSPGPDPGVHVFHAEQEDVRMAESSPAKAMKRWVNSE